MSSKSLGSGIATVHSTRRAAAAHAQTPTASRTRRFATIQQMPNITDWPELQMRMPPHGWLRDIQNVDRIMARAKDPDRFAEKADRQDA
jgi:hypothetical protein